MANGIELPLLYGAAAAALALIGPGAYSLDALLGLRALSTPALAWSALALGVIAGVGNLALRRSSSRVAVA
jgi:putative oxidoreductase